MYKLSFMLLLMLPIPHWSAAQEVPPVEWHFHAKKMSGNIYEIHCTADIESPWHIYSQHSESSITQPTVIFFGNNPFLKLSNSPAQEKGKIIEEEEKAVGATMRYYNDHVDFVKTVTLKAKVKTALTGFITFMACTNEKCLPPTKKKFSIPLK